MKIVTYNSVNDSQTEDREKKTNKAARSSIPKKLNRKSRGEKLNRMEEIKRFNFLFCFKIPGMKIMSWEVERSISFSNMKN